MHGVIMTKPKGIFSSAVKSKMRNYCKWRVGRYGAGVQGKIYILEQRMTKLCFRGHLVSQDKS